MTTVHAVRALADRGAAPEGHHYEARPDPETGLWLILGPADRPRMYRCRAGAGYHSKACGVQAVALMRRRGRTRVNWWAYCADHMYGRWIEDGEVMTWILVEDTSDGEP